MYKILVVNKYMASESVILYDRLIQALKAMEIQILLVVNCEKSWTKHDLWTIFKYLISNLDEFCLRLVFTCASNK